VKSHVKVYEESCLFGGCGKRDISGLAEITSRETLDRTIKWLF